MLEKEYNSDKYLILEVYAPWEHYKGYFGSLMSPFNFFMVNGLYMDSNAATLKDIVTNYMNNIPQGRWPNWVIENHDNTRAGSRMGAEMIDAMNMLILLLPGSSVVYQGEEIGMVDTHVRSYQILDCCGRDPERTPMQWNSDRNAGFSKANRTWLPVNTDYWKTNVNAQSYVKNSHLNTFRKLVELRKTLISSTELETATIGDWVFVFKRENKGQVYIIMINLNNREELAVLDGSLKDLPASLTVYIPSDNAAYTTGTSIKTSNPIHLRPRSGLVLKGV
uniref:Alpha-amylase n=1 Tax=Riptortus pedestris TaxID=329032 RepID=R4WR76_RIPPE|nr:alpha-amylase [Riptortus pedestris]